MGDAAIIHVVEDDDSLRQALIGLVRSLGYDGEGFASAEAFLDADAQHRAACLVTDLQLPGLGGLELKAMLAASGCALPDLKGAVHIGHSTGGGEVAHYVARAKPGRVAKAILVGACPNHAGYALPPPVTLSAAAAVS